MLTMTRRCCQVVDPPPKSIEASYYSADELVAKKSDQEELRLDLALAIYDCMRIIPRGLAREANAPQVDYFGLVFTPKRSDCKVWMIHVSQIWL